MDTNIQRAAAMKWNKGRAILITILVVAIPYGTLMLLFSLRNDQMSYFLPVRMYMSDAFNHHEFMLWNPFMSGSYPMHCDMQAPVWNPIVVLFSWLFNYNASLLAIELLLYYIIGTVGCFYFARNFSKNLSSCIVIAVVYGCCGFAIPCLEFMNWAASLAFLPWAIHFFYQLLKKGSVYTSIRLAIALWLLLVCGYPSFLIYLGYVMTGSTLAYFYLLYLRKRQREIRGILLFGLLSLLLFVAISLPAIHSFYEFLPYYPRGKRAFDLQLNSEFFAWNYPMSVIFPMAGELIWDNIAYIGLVPLLVLASGVIKKRVFNFRNLCLLSGFLFTFLFTMGRSAPLRMWSAKYLPLLGAFGYSHSVGIFLILILFVWLAPGLDTLFSGEREGRVKVLRYAAGVAGLLLLSYLAMRGDRSLFRTNLIRWVYYISAGWQLFLLAILFFFPRIYASGRRLFFFILADLMVSVFLVAPLAGFSVIKPRVYNEQAAAFYREDAGEFLLSTAARKGRMAHYDPHKDLNAMKVTARDNFPSRTRLESFKDFTRDSGRYARLLSLPFVFAADSTVLNVRAVDLGYNFISVDVQAAQDCRMVIEQMYYKRWRATQQEYAPSAADSIFLQVPLKRGENQVRLFYYGHDLAIEGIISVIVLGVLGIVLGVWYWRKINGLKDRKITELTE